MRRWGSLVVVVALTGGASIAIDVPGAGAAGPMPFPASTATVSQDAETPPLAGDFDGDGRGDLLWYTGRPGVDAIWFGQADRAPGTFTLNVGPGFRPAVGDFNGDGNDDILWVVPGGGADTPIWYGATGRGFIGGGGPASPANARPIVADIDGNGAQDVYFYNPTGPDGIFYGLRTGGFTTAPGNVGGNFETLVGNFDGDAAEDIAWYDAATGEGVLWWGGTTLVGMGLRPGGGFRMRAGDFNGDRITDLLWYHPSGPGAEFSAIWYGQRSRFFAGVGIPGGGDFDPIVGDFDANGFDDSFWYVPGSGPNYTWLSRPGGFDPYDAPAGPRGTPVVVDPDGNRADDLLFAVDGPGADTWWYSVSAGPTVPTISVTTVVGGLANPWDLAFTPDGTMLFTERAGRLSARLTDGTVRALSADLSDMFASGETGLMGIAVDPGFASNRRVYTCQGGPGPQVKVVAWQVDAGYTSAVRVVDPLVGGMPSTTGRHGGCRLRFDQTNALLIGTGDAASGANPQDLGSLGGKVLRVNPANGEGVTGNPFLASGNANTRKIVTFGHRNVQGLAIRPSTGQVFSVEHGPDRDDEVNLLYPGANFGWNPVPGYNEAVPMTFAGAEPAKWTSGASTVATSGATFLDGAQWGTWNGALAVATLKGQALRLQYYDAAGTFGGETVPTELNGTFGRLRSAVQGPDGALYLTTDNGSGDRVLRVSPR
jgi:glucose/arabinose dehydrogenase